MNATADTILEPILWIREAEQHLGRTLCQDEQEIVWYGTVISRDLLVETLNDEIGQIQADRLKQEAAQRLFDQELAKERRRQQVRETLDTERLRISAEGHAFGRRRTMADASIIDFDFKWLVEGVLTTDTFAVMAGPEKSHKTQLGLMMAVAVAGGRRWLDTFWVPEARPVVCYVGEGGEKPFVRRLQRVAESMRLDWTALPLHYRAGTLPIQSDGFQSMLAADLEELRPGLVWVDPLYAYTGGDISTGQLNSMGAVLNALSEPCVNSGAVLLLNAHTNRRDGAKGLRKVTGAGPAEWADSWLLIDPVSADPDTGDYRLTIDHGSRQWGGHSIVVDLHMGRFEASTGSYDGQLTVETNTRRGSVMDQAKTRIRRMVTDQPLALTRNQMRQDTSHDTFDAAWDELVAEGLLLSQTKHIMRRDGKPYPTEVWGWAE